MIKRLVDIARANVNAFFEKGNREKFSDNSPRETQFAYNNLRVGRQPSSKPPDPLAACYANLEIPPGSNREAVKSAWKRLLKKYHPDLHDADPEKRKVAGELTRRLTESYRMLDEELSNRG